MGFCNVPPLLPLETAGLDLLPPGAVTEEED